MPCCKSSKPWIHEVEHPPASEGWCDWRRPVRPRESLRIIAARRWTTIPPAPWLQANTPQSESLPKIVAVFECVVLKSGPQLLLQIRCTIYLLVQEVSCFILKNPTRFKCANRFVNKYQWPLWTSQGARFCESEFSKGCVQFHKFFFENSFFNSNVSSFMLLRCSVLVSRWLFPFFGFPMNFNGLEDIAVANWNVWIGIFICDEYQNSFLSSTSPALPEPLHVSWLS